MPAKTPALIPLHASSRQPTINEAYREFSERKKALCSQFHDTLRGDALVVGVIGVPEARNPSVPRPTAPPLVHIGVPSSMLGEKHLQAAIKMCSYDNKLLLQLGWGEEKEAGKRSSDVLWAMQALVSRILERKANSKSGKDTLTAMQWQGKKYKKETRCLVDRSNRTSLVTNSGRLSSAICAVMSLEVRGLGLGLAMVGSE